MQMLLRVKKAVMFHYGRYFKVYYDDKQLIAHGAPRPRKACLTANCPAVSDLCADVRKRRRRRTPRGESRGRPR